MEINEVKVGDMVTYKNKQGKQVKGKVIHRHSGKDASHLTGHVNIQNIGGVPSFPVTIHVSDIKPHITEETDMQNENVYTMIDSIQTGDTDRTETLFREIMNTKIADVLASNKEEVAKSMFNTNECADCEAEEVDEALKGNQHKIDANKNGKVDAHDFKLLRKKKGVKEEVEYMDEGNAENKRKKNLAISPFGQTSGTNMKQARADHAASEPKDPYVHPDRSKMGTTALKNAIKRVRRPASYRYKPTLPEEVEQVDEISQKTKDSYVAKRGSQLSSMMYGPSKNNNLLSGKRQAKAVKGIKQALNKEEVEQVDEDTFEQGGKTKMDFKTPRHVSPHFKYLKKLSPAEEKADMLKRAGLKDVSKKPPAVKKEEVAHEAYSDPYAAKKSAEMKKAHAATMADAKKEYDAARKPKFAKNFMKMKKEDVELEEGNAENKMKKNTYADAKGAANKNGALDRGSQRRVDRYRTDEVDSIKKGIDNYAPKKAAVRNIIRGKVFGKLSDTETKMFARKRVKEDVNLQELHADTLRSYISKRAKPGQLDAARKGDSTAKKQVKGISNANASLTKKYKSKLDAAYNNAAAASYNKAKPGTYHGD